MNCVDGYRPLHPNPKVTEDNRDMWHRKACYRLMSECNVLSANGSFVGNPWDRDAAQIDSVLINEGATGPWTNVKRSAQGKHGVLITFISHKGTEALMSDASGEPVPASRFPLPIRYRQPQGAPPPPPRPHVLRYPPHRIASYRIAYNWRANVDRWPLPAGCRCSAVPGNILLIAKRGR